MEFLSGSCAALELDVSLLSPAWESAVLPLSLLSDDCVTVGESICNSWWCYIMDVLTLCCFFH